MVSQNTNTIKAKTKTKTATGGGALEQTTEARNGSYRRQTAKAMIGGGVRRAGMTQTMFSSGSMQRVVDVTGQNGLQRISFPGHGGGMIPISTDG